MTDLTTRAEFLGSAVAMVGAVARSITGAVRVPSPLSGKTQPARAWSGTPPWLPVVGSESDDDTAAVREAIASVGYVGAVGVVFPARRAPWLIDPIEVDVPGMRIRGMPGAVVQLRTPSRYRMFTATAPDVIFEDLVLDGGSSAPYTGDPGSLYGHALITFDATDGGAVRRCTLQNSGNSGVAISCTGRVVVEDNLFRALGWIGVYAHTFGVMAAYDNKILRNTFRNFTPARGHGAAVQLVGHTFDPGSAQIGFQIEGNTVDSWALLQGLTTYGRCENGIIRGNVVRGPAWGISLGSGAYSCVVDHNTCRGNASYGIEMAGTTDCTCSNNTVDGRDLNDVPVNETGILIARDQDDTVGGVNTTVANNNVRHGLPASQGIYGAGAEGLQLLGNTVGGYFTNIQCNDCTKVMVHVNQFLAPVNAQGGHLKFATGGHKHNNGSMVQMNRFEGACEEVLRLYAANGFEIRTMVVTQNHLVGVRSTYPALQIDTADTIHGLILRDNYSDSDDLTDAHRALTIA